MSRKLVVGGWLGMQDAVVMQWVVKHYALLLCGGVTYVAKKISNISGLR